MIDIETLDTANSAVIFQIGVVIFDGPKVLEEFCLDIQVSTQLEKAGVYEPRTVSASTLAFWLNPKISGVAHKALTSKDAVPIGVALKRLWSYLNEHKLDAVWAKGSFDFNLLEHACEQYGVAVPWKYFMPRDLRTMMKECSVSKHDNISHNALDDCQNQHRQLMECRSRVDRTERMWQAASDYRMALRYEAFAEEHGGVEALGKALDVLIDELEA